MTLPALVLLVLAAFGLILSGVFGAQVMNLKIALWYSDNDWMRTDVITDADQLRRYHVLTMWTVLGSHRDAAANKLKRLKQGITVLYVALAILAVAILLVTSNVLIQPQSADSHITVGDD